LNSMLETNLTMGKLFLALTVAGTLLGCGDACEDYCEVFVERTQDCGLGGPSGDEAIEQCGEEVGEVLEDDACDTASGNISSMSCDEFRSLVCSQPSATSTYNCD
jgi:hypothetical protein